MALGQEADPALKRAFQDQIKDLNTTVALPFMLEMYADYESDVLSRSDFLTAVGLIESYTFRRAILEIPTNSMNKTFSEFSRFVRKDRYLDSIKANFLSLPSYRRFPRDAEFSQALQQRDMYNIYSRQYWLRKLENHGKLELIALEECTVEHVLPQNPDLSKEWQAALGENWQEIQAQFLHNLGNLTLTRYNSSFSDRPYAFKRSLEVNGQKVGLAHSPFSLNADFANEEVWDQSAIARRARRLAGKAIQVWAIPELSSEDIKEFEPELESPRGTNYSYDDHKYLSSDHVRTLFDALKFEVLALDPCVSESVLKQYVAFKAETNFVDVVPQAKRLRLSLNMKVSQLDDPRNIAKDISEVGRWGNGDVEIGFESLDQLPYVMSLIRQSFNRQMSIENELS
jgi:predicted transport protein